MILLSNFRALYSKFYVPNVNRKSYICYFAIVIIAAYKLLIFKFAQRVTSTLTRSIAYQ